jgi:hypothetical protein
LTAIMGDLNEWGSLKGITSLQQLRDFLTGEGQNLDFQKGRTWIEYFSNMMNLTPQQQLDLYEQLRQILGDRLSESDYMSLNETIKGLQDGLKTVAEPISSQAYRSVTTITEIQANSMISVLNAISLHVRLIYERLLTAASGVMGNMQLSAPGGLIVNGNIVINADTQTTGRRVLAEISSEARGRGVKAA